MKEDHTRMLIETGRNGAGYPEYARKKSEQEESPSAEPRSRRAFLKLFGGGLGSAALGTIALEHFIPAEANAPAVVEETKEQKESVPAADAQPERLTGAGEEFSDSRYFNSAVSAYVAEYRSELPAVLAFAEKTTKGDERGRSRIAYVQEMLTVPNVPEGIQNELQQLIAGLGFVESRYDASEVSSEGARGILQILPMTWEELGTPNGNALSLAEQTRVAGEVFSRSYAYLTRECEDELSVIRTEFFGGDETAFERYFLTPALLNAYNAGMGTMKKLIHWFVRAYGTQEDAIGALNQAEALSGYDVFYAMAARGLADAPVDAYKKYASEYPMRIYGARQCLDGSESSRDVST